MESYYLIKQRINNPFVLWPGYTNERYFKFIVSQLEDQNNNFKTFIDKTNDSINCYIQIEKLSWDTNFFKFNCAKIRHIFINEELSFEKITLIASRVGKLLHDYFKSHNYKFIFADIDAHSSKLNYFIQKIGFLFVINWLDGYVRSDKNRRVGLPNDNLIKQGEVERVAHIAKQYYYKGGRFYSDPNFQFDQIDQMYYQTIINSYNNKDIIIVERHNKIPIGAFISKEIKVYKEFDNLRVAHLRFLVIDPAYRGLNIGYKLFTQIIDIMTLKSDIIVTGLESNNIVSLNLHNKFYFKYNYSHNAYHLWLR